MKPLLVYIVAALSIASCKPRTQASPVTDPVIFDRHWKLVELNGQPVPATNKEPHMVLNLAEKRVTGNGGCNSFFGSFEHPTPLRISFSNIGSTKMACPNMETESRFFEVLGMADNYTTKGDTLSINKAKMAPLARFVATTR